MILKIFKIALLVSYLLLVSCSQSPSLFSDTGNQGMVKSGESGDKIVTNPAKVIPSPKSDPSNDSIKKPEPVQEVNVTKKLIIYGVDNPPKYIDNSFIEWVRTDLYPQWKKFASKQKNLDLVSEYKANKKRGIPSLPPKTSSPFVKAVVSGQLDLDSIWFQLGVKTMGDPRIYAEKVSYADQILKDDVKDFIKYRENLASELLTSTVETHKKAGTYAKKNKKYCFQNKINKRNLPDRFQTHIDNYFTYRYRQFLKSYGHQAAQLSKNLDTLRTMVVIKLKDTSATPLFHLSDREKYEVRSFHHESPDHVVQAKATVITQEQESVKLYSNFLQKLNSKKRINSNISEGIRKEVLSVLEELIEYRESKKTRVKPNGVKKRYSDKEISSMVNFFSWYKKLKTKSELYIALDKQIGRDKYSNKDVLDLAHKRWKNGKYK